MVLCLFVCMFVCFCCCYYCFGLFLLFVVFWGVLGFFKIIFPVVCCYAVADLEI